MASAISLLSEEQFLCSICLDVFTEPVSTPCGHNFCKACITKYWDNNGQCDCPMCKKSFANRPDLFVNTLVSEMAAQFRKSVDVKAASSESHNQEAAKPVEVPCDVCSGTKLKALKSCLVCLASYCETHLEPHQRVAALKRHKLIDPVENLEDRMCKKHDKFLDLFCRTDQICVCVMCTEHKTHDTVPLEEEYEEKKAQLGKKKAEVQEMIQERQQKVQEMKASVKISKKDTEEEIAKSVEVFTALVASIQRNQAELIEVIEEKQRAAEKQAEGFIKELEQEISELQRRSTELERLSHTEDHLHLLQSFPSCSSSPHTNNWSGISVRTDARVDVKTVRRAVAQLEKTLTKEMTTLLKDIEGIKEDLEKLPEDVRLRRIQQLYAVDVTLDPNTAHPQLILSEDGKKVRCGDTRQNLPDNPERFDHDINILGKEGFSSGRFYFEVQVKGHEWDLGVVRESINRKGNISYSPKKGHWIILLRDGNDYRARDNTRFPLSLRQKPEKVGVFVDYEEGLVSFYDVEAETLIYSFTGCTFKEKIYPLFSPSYDDGEENSAPLIITPVKHTE
ncbi:E3 ubiquitin-protein ligase TRIM39-like [Centroberyx gerrardi]